MKITKNASVEYVKDQGIVPVGTTGTVRGIHGNDYLVEWNHPDPSRKGNLFNWHRSSSLRAI